MPRFSFVAPELRPQRARFRAAVDEWRLDPAVASAGRCATSCREPYRYGVCHCATCRKESGGVFVVCAHWRRETAEVVGPYRTFEGRSFCPACGSRLFDLHENDIEVRVGSLDEAPTTLGRPSVEGWIKRREPWLRRIAAAKQSLEDPPRSG